MGETTVKTRLRPDDMECGEPLLPRVVDMEPLSDYRLRLLFSNGEERIFDARSYLGGGVFEEMRKPEVFNEAWIEAGSVEWPTGAGLSYETLYLESVPVEARSEQP